MAAACEKAVILGEELGLSSSEMATLHKAGKLEEAMCQAVDKFTFEQLDSIEFFSKTGEFLKPFQGKYMPEMEVRKLIHETGIPTFPRPKGIPENYRVKLSGKGVGIKYVHPTNEGTSIRLMPGKPHSTYPHQQKPYVIHMKNGKTLDKLGNVLLENDLQAHIPLEEFIFIGG